MSKTILFFTLLAFVFMVCIVSHAYSKKRLTECYPWLCYYGDFKGKNLPSGLKLAVLDPDTSGNINKLAGKNIYLVGYLSLGEAENFRWYWKEVKQKPFILGKNPNWEGDYFIDPRSPEWKDYIIHRIIPQILDKGFNGLFLDTIDTAEYLEWKNPKKFKGAIDAMVGIIAEIRLKYPDIIIIPNNGQALWDRIAGYSDAILVESTFTTYDFAKKKYLIQDKNITEERVKRLKEVSSKFEIPILALDYVLPSDTKRAEDIKLKSRLNGFYPYITDISLQKLPKKIDKEK